MHKIPPPPKGYRRLRKTEDPHHLSIAGLLREYCRCGHLQTDHAGHTGHAHCKKCRCPHYTWAAWITPK